MRVASDTSSEYSRVASQNEYSFHSRVLASTRYSRVDVPLLEAGTVLELQAKVSLTGLSKDEFAKNEAKTKFYTGLPNFLVLLQVFNLC